jgi:DNA repair exonuclease SbcCD nuclease subunit
VLVAGDVFDDNAVSDQTLRRTLEAMRGFAGPWVLLPGNHDAALAESVWTRMRRLGLLPDNVHLALEAEPLLLCSGRLAVLPAPLRRRREADDLTAWYDAAETPEGAVRVGLAHGSVDNRLPAEAVTGNPIADTRADSAGLDYLALGDWHGTLEIAPRTWYAGTPETDRFRGNDSGHVLEVALPGPGAAPEITRHATSHYRWHRLEATLSGEDDLAALDDRLAGLGEPWERQVVQLGLSGTPGLGLRSALGDVLARWDARFQYLRVDDGELTVAAADGDLAPLRAAGFVGAAVERLIAARERGEPWADDALQRLYLAWHRRRGAGT